MNFEENLELKEFSKNLNLVILPSMLWGIHVDPEYQFIAILHIQVTLPSKVNIDKGILVTYNNTHNVITTSLFIQNELVDIPALSPYIKVMSDLSHLIYFMHNLKLCPNSDKLDAPQCNKYIDLEKFDNYCNSCQWMNKRDNSLWKDFNYMQDLVYTNSLSSEDIVTDNLVKQTNLCSKINKDIDKDYNEGKLIEFDKNKILENKCQLENDKQNDLFLCKVCKKNFSTENLLREHLCVHTEEKIFVCEICNKTTNRRSTHQKHILTHSNNKPNLCNICGKTYCQGYQMKDHLLTHSSERPFECKICHKGFVKSYNLKLHQKTHSGIRSYICSTCGKTYTTQSNLSTHIRSVHTNKKPHTCNNCNMSFVHPRHLRIHMRKHTGEKPYKCTICEKGFSKNIHLTIHTRIHTGEKPHTCTICGKGFTTTGNLSSHKRIHHKDLNLTEIQ